MVKLPRLKLTDYKLFNSRPVPVGYELTYRERDLRAFMAYCDSRHIRKREIAANCNFLDDRTVLALYTDFLPDSFIVEHSSMFFDPDVEEFELNLACVTGVETHAKRSQRLVLLEGKFAKEIMESNLDFNVAIHYGNASSNGVHYETGQISYIRSLDAPRRIPPVRNPLHFMQTTKPAR